MTAFGCFWHSPAFDILSLNFIDSALFLLLALSLFFFFLAYSLSSLSLFLFFVLSDAYSLSSSLYLSILSLFWSLTFFHFNVRSLLLSLPCALSLSYFPCLLSFLSLSLALPQANSLSYLVWRDARALAARVFVAQVPFSSFQSKRVLGRERWVAAISRNFSLQEFYLSKLLCKNIIKFFSK